MAANRFMGYMRSKLTAENVHGFLRFYNLATAVLVIGDYINNYGTKDTKNPVEYFGDIAVHLIHATLTKDSHWLHKQAAVLTNGYRLFDIPNRMASGSATVPNGIAIVDAVNHVVNTIDATTLLNSESGNSLKMK